MPVPEDFVLFPDQQPDERTLGIRLFPDQDTPIFGSAVDPNEVERVRLFPNVGPPREQQEAFAIRALKTLGEASGIPSLARSALTLLPEQASRPIRDSFREMTGKEIGRASPGDHIVSAITLMGGVGLKGALTLAGKAARGAFRPIVEMAPKNLREVMKNIAKGVPEK